MALKIMLRTLKYTGQPLEFFQTQHPHDANYLLEWRTYWGVAKEKAGRDNAVVQRGAIGLRWWHIASEMFRKE